MSLLSQCPTCENGYVTNSHKVCKNCKEEKEITKLMKYKIGDKVKIKDRDDLVKYLENELNSLNPPRVVTVKSVETDVNKKTYFTTYETGMNCRWWEHEIEEVKEIIEIEEIEEIEYIDNRFEILDL